MRAEVTELFATLAEHFGKEEAPAEVVQAASAVKKALRRNEAYIADIEQRDRTNRAQLRTMIRQNEELALELKAIPTP